MIFLEMSNALAGWDIEIIGNDISKEALNRGKAGPYT